MQRLRFSVARPFRSWTVIFRPVISVPSDVPMATLPSTTSFGPNFSQIVANLWTTSLMWNPFLAMSMAYPLHRDFDSVNPPFILLSSSSSKGKKRPPPPLVALPPKKIGRYYDTIMVERSNDEGDSSDEIELAEPFDPLCYNSLSNIRYQS